MINRDRSGSSITVCGIRNEQQRNAVLKVLYDRFRIKDNVSVELALKWSFECCFRKHHLPLYGRRQRRRTIARHVRQFLEKGVFPVYVLQEVGLASNTGGPIFRVFSY